MCSSSVDMASCEHNQLRSSISGYGGGRGGDNADQQQLAFDCFEVAIVRFIGSL